MKIPMPLDESGFPSRSPLLRDSDKVALDAMLDALTSRVCSQIEDRVREEAVPLLKQGYWAHELLIVGYGQEIIVRPGMGHVKGRFHLWARRVASRLRFFPDPNHHRVLGSILILDGDTFRIVRRFGLLRDLVEVQP